MKVKWLADGCVVLFLVNFLDVVTPYGIGTRKIIGGADDRLNQNQTRPRRTSIPKSSPDTIYFSGGLLKNSCEVTCAVTILSDRYVITAAHCVSPGSAEDFQILDGTYSVRDCKRGLAQLLPVKTIQLHPYYRGGTSDDLAVLELSKPFNFTSGRIRPVCLPRVFRRHYNPVYKRSISDTNAHNNMVDSGNQRTVRAIANNRLHVNSSTIRQTTKLKNNSCNCSTVVQQPCNCTANNANCNCTISPCISNCTLNQPCQAPMVQQPCCPPMSHVPCCSPPYQPPCNIPPIGPNPFLCEPPCIAPDLLNIPPPFNSPPLSIPNDWNAPQIYDMPRWPKPVQPHLIYSTPKPIIGHGGFSKVYIIPTPPPTKPTVPPYVEPIWKSPLPPQPPFRFTPSENYNPPPPPPPQFPQLPPICLSYLPQSVPAFCQPLLQNSLLYGQLQPQSSPFYIPQIQQSSPLFGPPQPLDSPMYQNPQEQSTLGSSSPSLPNNPMYSLSNPQNPPNDNSRLQSRPNSFYGPPEPQKSPNDNSRLQSRPSSFYNPPEPQKPPVYQPMQPPRPQNYGTPLPQRQNNVFPVKDSQPHRTDCCCREEKDCPLELPRCPEMECWNSRRIRDTQDSILIRRGQFSMINNFDCKRYFPEKELDGRQFCIENHDGFPCNGDSGSPIVMEEQNGCKFSLIGVVSGANVCRYNLPTICTSIAPYTPWIQQILEN